jgi:NADH dehydrogenase FAD-containing subunit
MRAGASRARVERRRVLVAGAGFAGVRTAKRLEAHCDVSLLAPTDRFVYLPLIHEVLSEGVTPGTVTKRLEEILPRTTLIHGRAARVEGKKLHTAGGEVLPFDDLVVAVGAEPHDFGVPGAAEHALPFYSVGDALRANATLKVQAAEAAGPVRVVVVGAGFTGVEVAGEAASLLDKLDVPREVLLLDALPEIFPRQTADFRAGVQAGLKRLGLNLETGQRIQRVVPGAVHIAAAETPERSVAADVLFWCAGVKPRRIDGVDPHARRTLQSVSSDHVWLVGDAADLPRELAVPKLAQTAEEQAELVAHNILEPDDMREYAPNVKGLIVSIGHGYAVAELAGGQVFTGRVPWHVKRTLYKAKIALA